MCAVQQKYIYVHVHTLVIILQLFYVQVHGKLRSSTDKRTDLEVRGHEDDEYDTSYIRLGI